MIALYLPANLTTGHPFWVSLLVVCYTMLMFRHFFISDKLRRSLPLTLATHTPIVPIMLWHGFSLFAAEHDRSLRELNWNLVVPFIIMVWLAVLAWEIARKIRSPQEESAYVTYSQILGRRGAVALTAAAQTVTFVLGVYFFTELGLPLVYLIVLTAGYGLALAGHLRFWLRPNPSTSKLKPFAERYVMAVVLAGVLAAGAGILGR